MCCRETVFVFCSDRKTFDAEHMNQSSHREHNHVRLQQSLRHIIHLRRDTCVITQSCSNELKKSKNMGNYCRYRVKLFCKSSCHSSHLLLRCVFLKLWNSGHLLAYFGLFGLFQGSCCKIWLKLLSISQTMITITMGFGISSKILLRFLKHLSELIHHLKS